jgi:hypothetical protein
MLRNFSEPLFSDRELNSQTRGPNGSERARDNSAELNMQMERKMSSQTFTHTNEHRSSLAGSMLLTVFRHIADGFSALGGRFMNALCESRLRQANRVIQQYRHLIDHSDD